MASLLVPPFAPPGSRVHVVAPAWAIDRERVAAGIAWLEGAGYEVVVPSAVRAKHRFLAGDDATRVAGLRVALADDAARVIWVAQGGYGSARLLCELEPAEVAAHPKLLVGFSDATALHALWHRAGLATIHGPNLSTLPSAAEEVRDGLVRLLAGAPGVGLEGTYEADAEVAGRLLGGNLSLLAALVGTSALPDLQGALLLIEDVDERTYRLDRYAQQLLQSGVLDEVAGFVFGQFTKCGPTRGDRAGPETILREAFADLGRPVLSGVAIGHGDDAQAVWLGRRVRVVPTRAGRAILSGEA